MKVLDLFCGLKGWSAPFAAAGHETFTIDIDGYFAPDLAADILTVTAEDILSRFGKPDIILASPPCECFSVMSFHLPLLPQGHRTGDQGPDVYPLEAGSYLVRAPRGSRTGTQGLPRAEAAKVPFLLAEAVRIAAEKDLI